MKRPTQTIENLKQIWRAFDKLFRHLGTAPQPFIAWAQDRSGFYGYEHTFRTTCNTDPPPSHEGLIAFDVWVGETQPRLERRFWTESPAGDARCEHILLDDIEAGGIPIYIQEAQGEVQRKRRAA